MKNEKIAFWIFILLLLLLVGVCAYSKGYSIGAREQQMRDFGHGSIIISSQDERIKQLESVLTVNKIEIPKE